MTIKFARPRITVEIAKSIRNLIGLNPSWKEVGLHSIQYANNNGAQCLRATFVIQYKEGLFQHLVSEYLPFSELPNDEFSFEDFEVTNTK